MICFLSVFRTVLRGTASLISSSRLPASSVPAETVTPVMFPLGRGMLATNPVSTGFRPDFDRISTEAHDDGNRSGRVPRRLHCIRADCVDDLHPKLNQLAGQCRKTVELATGESPFDDEVLAFNVAKLVQGRGDQVHCHPIRRGGRGSGREHAQTVHFPCWLRPGGQWRGEGGNGHDERDAAVLHDGLPGRRVWDGPPRASMHPARRPDRSPRRLRDTFPARPRETGDQPGPDRIVTGAHDHGDPARCLLHCQNRLLASGDNDVDIEANEFRGQSGNPIGPAVGPAVLEVNVLALHIAEFAEPLPESLDGRVGSIPERGPQHTDPRELRGRLRMGCERGRQDPEREGGDDGSPYPHEELISSAPLSTPAS
jgi:hypothetical protein